MGIQGRGEIELGLGKMHFFPFFLCIQTSKRVFGKALKTDEQIGKVLRAPGEGSPVERLDQVSFQGGWASVIGGLHSAHLQGSSAHRGLGQQACNNAFAGCPVGGGWSGSLGERKWLTTPTHPLALLPAWGMCSVLSSWHLCVPHYLPFPKMGAVVYRNCLSSHFPEEKSKSQREAAASTGPGEPPVALGWPGARGSSCPCSGGVRPGQLGYTLGSYGGHVLSRVPGGLLRKLVWGPWLRKCAPPLGWHQADRAIRDQ